MTKSFTAIFMAAALSLPVATVSQAAENTGHTGPQNFLNEIDYNAQIERPDFLDLTDTTPPQALDEAADLFMTAHDNIRRMSIVRPDVTELANRSLWEIFRATDSCRYIDYPAITAPVDAEQLKVPLKLLDMCSGPEQDVMQVTEKTLETMVEMLDPQSYYNTPDEAEDVYAGFQGKFGGIGVLWADIDEGYYIEESVDNNPAYNAGIRRGDVIVSIDGVRLAGLDKKDAPQLRGDVGEPVDLRVRRNNRTFDVTITRDVIKNNPVRGHMLGEDIAYLQLHSFPDPATALRLGRLIKDMQSEHGDSIRGYVLDIRKNPGGYTSQGIAVADLFLDDGKITTVGTARNLQESEYSAAPGDILNGMPLTVLIDENSASSAEIVAAALQDNGRATIIGNRSYGKGSVQDRYQLPNDGLLWLTSKLYFTPNGHSIQGRGVIPDINYVPLTPPKEEPEYAKPLGKLPDGITFDDHRSTQTCSPAANDPVRNTQEEFMFVDGSVDYALICAAERLRNEQRRTVQRPMHLNPPV